jgi:hypothetical protein
MRRVYTDVSAFRAPFRSPNISFAGLGADHAAYDVNRWPAGRSYHDVSQYRMPYRAGYYQSGALRGTDGGVTSGQAWALAAVVIGTIAFGLMGDVAKGHIKLKRS